MKLQFMKLNPMERGLERLRTVMESMCTRWGIPVIGCYLLAYKPISHSYTPHKPKPMNKSSYSSFRPWSISNLIAKDVTTRIWQGNSALSLFLARSQFWQKSMDHASSSWNHPSCRWTLVMYYLFWLVVWNIFIFPYIGNNHPNWLIFFRGVQTTNQFVFGRTECE